MWLLAHFKWHYLTGLAALTAGYDCFDRVALYRATCGFSCTPQGAIAEGLVSGGLFAVLAGATYYLARTMRSYDGR